MKQASGKESSSGFVTGTRGFATTVQYDLGNNGANGLYKGTMPASGCPVDFAAISRNDNGFVFGTTVAGSPYATANLMNATTGTPYGGNINTGNINRGNVNTGNVNRPSQQPAGGGTAWKSDKKPGQEVEVVGDPDLDALADHLRRVPGDRLPLAGRREAPRRARQGRGRWSRERPRSCPLGVLDR